MDMVERVARAIRAKEDAHYGQKPADEEYWADPGTNADVFRDMARAAIAAMQQWQPIETAPKDGTRIFLGDKDGAFMIGHWNGHAGWDDGDFSDHETWPTHWMPLPEPPVTPEVALTDAAPGSQSSSRARRA